MGKLNGKVAVITAATSGMALATAKRYVEEGAYVFITGRNKQRLDKAVKEIGKNVTGVQADSSNLADLNRLYETVKKEKGKIDILFASAGEGSFATIEEVTQEHFDSTFNQCARHTVYGAEGAAAVQQQRLHHSEWIDCGREGLPAFRRLLGEQSGGAVVRAHMAAGVEGPRHPRECA
jgi:NAD(P)-dependent dehydrogenase (short-subunit alcohol dehydrogenase family)